MAPASKRGHRGAQGPTVLTVPRVRAFLEQMIQGDSLVDAARTAGLRLTRARVLMRNPAVRKAFFDGIEVLRDSERARNILLGVKLRDAGLDPGASAAAKKVALEAARYLDGSDGKQGLVVNVGVQIGPGLIVDLSDDPGDDAGTFEGKVLIAHEKPG